MDNDVGRQLRVGRKPIRVLGVGEQLLQRDVDSHRLDRCGRTALDDEEVLHPDLATDFAADKVRDAELGRRHQELHGSVHRHDGQVGRAQPLPGRPAAPRMEAALPDESHALAQLQTVLRNRAQRVRGDGQRLWIPARESVLVDDQHVVRVEGAASLMKHREHRAGLARIGLCGKHHCHSRRRHASGVKQDLPVRCQHESQQRLDDVGVNDVWRQGKHRSHRHDQRVSEVDREVCEYAAELLAVHERRGRCRYAPLQPGRDGADDADSDHDVVRGGRVGTEELQLREANVGANPRHAVDVIRVAGADERVETHTAVLPRSALVDQMSQSATR